MPGRLDQKQRPEHGHQPSKRQPGEYHQNTQNRLLNPVQPLVDDRRSRSRPGRFSLATWSGVPCADSKAGVRTRMITTAAQGPKVARPAASRRCRGGRCIQGVVLMCGTPRRSARPLSPAAIEELRERTEKARQHVTAVERLVRSDHDRSSTVEKTRAVRFLGSISQTIMTPAAKYSRTLRAISAGCFPR